jgi:hypothetical protein
MGARGEQVDDLTPELIAFCHITLGVATSLQDRCMGSLLLAVAVLGLFLA